MSRDNGLYRLLKRVENSKHAVIQELRKRYPVDSTILCRLRYDQVNPTIMYVMKHNGDGYVRAWMPSKNGRYVRNIHFTDIFRCS